MREGQEIRSEETNRASSSHEGPGPRLQAASVRRRLLPELWGGMAERAAYLVDEALGRGITKVTTPWSRV